VLKTVIISLQVSFTGDFALSNRVSGSQTLTPLFSLTVPNFVVFCQVIG